ncbi:MAG: RNA polymerase sigma factor [Gaiella sp.]
MTRTARDAAVDVDEHTLLAELRAGSETAFRELVDEHGASMLRVARLRAPSQAVAEEIVQETWLRVLRGLERFEGRSSLRTWIFVILANCANRRVRQEGRSIPFAALADEDGDPSPAVAPDRFFPAEHPRWPRCWSSLVDGWAEVPDAHLLTLEMRDVLRRALASLPPGQREVMMLRDVEGWHADEVCAFLELTPENQRVLLHRARVRVRENVSRYLESSSRD